MIKLLKNHLFRTWDKKMRFFLMLALITAALMLALFLSSRGQAPLKIAYIGSDQVLTETKNLKLTQLKDQPPKSELALGNYDAIVDFSSDLPEITTFKNAKFKQQITQQLLNQTVPKSNLTQQPSKAQRILGYMLMFLLMQCVANSFLYSEDKEKHVMERMLCSGISQTKLFLAYFIHLFLLLFGSVFIIFFVLNKVFQIDLGLSLGTYAYLLALINLFGISFALCNAAFFKNSDQANMMGSMLMVITTLLSGSFFSIENGSHWWTTMTSFLPQKQLLELVDQFSQGQTYQTNFVKVAYLLSISMVFLVVTVWKNKKNYSR